jgi:hypothetical protein
MFSRLTIHTVRRMPVLFVLCVALFCASATVGVIVSGHGPRSLGTRPVVRSCQAGPVFRHNALMTAVAVAAPLSGGLSALVVVSGSGYVAGRDIGDARADGLSTATLARLTLPHGILEVPALCLACALGLRWTMMVFGWIGAPRVSVVVACAGLVILMIAAAALTECDYSIPSVRSVEKSW